MTTGPQEIVIRIRLELDPATGAVGAVGGAADPEPRLYRVPEVADLLAISETSVEELIASGQLASVKIGKSRRVSRDALTNYIRRLSIAAARAADDAA